jgi:hypothetical protein
MLVLWVLTPCGLVGSHQLFGGTYCLHFEGWKCLHCCENLISHEATSFMNAVVAASWKCYYKYNIYNLLVKATSISDTTAARNRSPVHSLVLVAFLAIPAQNNKLLQISRYRSDIDCSWEESGRVCLIGTKIALTPARPIYSVSSPINVKTLNLI